MSAATSPTGAIALPTAAPRIRPRITLGITDIVAIAMLGLVAAVVAIPPLLPFYDPYLQNLSAAQLAPFADAAHLLGTDPLGRDVLSRLSLAGQISLLIAAAVVVINFVLGVSLGLIAGYFGGRVDNIIMGIADMQLAMPFVLLLIALSAVLGPSTALMIIMLGVTFWVGYGRVARGMAMTLREREYVLAPVTQGAGNFWILRKHLLPAVVPQLAIIASFDIGVVVIAQASLDFLGLGVQPPVPTWGGMIAEGQKYLQVNPWLAILPGIAMFLLIGGVQFLSQRFTAEGTTVRRRDRRK